MVPVVFADNHNVDCGQYLRQILRSQDGSVFRLHQQGIILGLRRRRRNLIG